MPQVFCKYLRSRVLISWGYAAKNLARFLSLMKLRTNSKTKAISTPSTKGETNPTKLPFLRLLKIGCSSRETAHEILDDSQKRAPKNFDQIPSHPRLDHCPRNIKINGAQAWQLHEHSGMPRFRLRELRNLPFGTSRKQDHSHYQSRNKYTRQKNKHQLAMRLGLNKLHPIFDHGFS